LIFIFVTTWFTRTILNYTASISTTIVNPKGVTAETMKTMVEVLVKRLQEPEMGEDMVLHELVKRASSRPNSFRKHLFYRLVFIFIPISEGDGIFLSSQSPILSSDYETTYTQTMRI
jgi:hypothetical protein